MKKRLEQIVPLSVAICYWVSTVAGNVEVFKSYHDKWGDHAVDGFQILRAENWMECLGPYSRFGWHHPGPAMFYYLAAFDHILPFASGQGAHLFGQVCLNAICLGWLSILLARASRFSAVGAFAAAFFLSVMPLPGDIWAPSVVLMPLALFFAAASVTIDGSTTRGLIPLALSSIVCMQSQLGMCAVVVPCGFLALCLFAWQRHRMRLPLTKGDLIVLGVAVASVIIAWIPPVYEQLTHTPGNFTLINDFFSRHHGHQHWHLVLKQIYDSAGEFARLLTGAKSIGKPLPCFVIFFALLSILPVFLSRGFARQMGIVYAAALLFAVFAIRRVVGDFFPHIFFFLPIIFAFGFATILVWITEIEAKNSRTNRHAPRIDLILVLMLTAYAGFRRPDMARIFDRCDDVEAICNFLKPQLGETIWFNWPTDDDGHMEWPVAAGVALRLVEQGSTVRMPDDRAIQFGKELCSGTPQKFVPVFFFDVKTHKSSPGKIPFPIARTQTIHRTRIVICEVQSRP